MKSKHLNKKKITICNWNCFSVFFSFSFISITMKKVSEFLQGFNVFAFIVLGLDNGPVSDQIRKRHVFVCHRCCYTKKGKNHFERKCDMKSFDKQLQNGAFTKQCTFYMSLVSVVISTQSLLPYTERAEH